MNYCKTFGVLLNQFGNLRKRLQTNIYSMALIELGRLQRTVTVQITPSSRNLEQSAESKNGVIPEPQVSTLYHSVNLTMLLFSFHY